MKTQEMQQASESGGTRARARFKQHLACHGWWPAETDALGPVAIWVKGGDCVQLWRRTDKEKSDWWMTLEKTVKVSYE